MTSRPSAPAVQSRRSRRDVRRRVSGWTARQIWTRRNPTWSLNCHIWLMLRYGLAGCWWWSGAALYCVYLSDQLLCDECFMIVCLSYAAVQQHYNWEINRSVATPSPKRWVRALEPLCSLNRNITVRESSNLQAVDICLMSGQEVRLVIGPRHAPLQPDVVASRATKEEGWLLDVVQTCRFNISWKNIFANIGWKKVLNPELNTITAAAAA